ncbi:MAG: hypothetical protein VB934_10340 [Polyangiaceae bacterium]
MHKVSGHRAQWVFFGCGLAAFVALAACGSETTTEGPAGSNTVGAGPASVGSTHSAVTSSTGSGSGGDGGDGGMGGAGGSEPMNVCGNGKIEVSEECDDKNSANGDGCSSSCQVEKGYDCDGEPSMCKPTEPVTYTVGPGIAAVLKYGLYDGSLASMECISVMVPDTGHDDIQWVQATLGIDHDHIGELVIKVRSPKLTVTTLMNLPGYAEMADDGFMASGGDSSNLDMDYPVLFDDDAANDAEQMGDGLWAWNEVCKDDNKCAWSPNAGAGPGTGLKDFKGESPVGAWRVCVGDALFDHFGQVDMVSLTILAW